MGGASDEIVLQAAGFAGSTIAVIKFPVLRSDSPHRKPIARD
jgi:hypothetical protein